MQSRALKDKVAQLEQQLDEQSKQLRDASAKAAKLTGENRDQAQTIAQLQKATNELQVRNDWFFVLT